MNSIKLLGLEQTLEIYFIVSPHLPKDITILTHYDICSAVFDALTPDEFIGCITILTGVSKNEIIREDALEYFIQFVDGLKLNNILSLPDLFKKIGFTD